MKMYVANASIKRYEFTWRVLEHSKPRTLVIQPLGQIQLAGDFTMEDLKHVVEQHEPYGFVSVQDCLAGRIPKRQTELMFSVDAPISSLAINTLYDYNRGVLTELGKQMRKELAVVANTTVARALQVEREQQGLDATVSDVEVTLAEEENTRDGNVEPVSEVINVDAGRPRRRSQR